MTENEIATVVVDAAFKVHSILGGKVIIEIKSLDAVAPVAYKILLTYLRLTDMRLGLLINFRVELIKTGIRRVVNGL